MQTRIALSEKALQEAQAAADPMVWHEYASMIMGYIVFVVAALVLLFIAVDVLTERRWLRKKQPQDIPDFVVCTCPTFLNNTTNANHTAVPSIQTWTRQNPKCPVHSAAGKAPRRVEPQEQARRGGGDTREGA